MASWVFCNRCFQQPRGASCFSLTSCGHVYCDDCLRKGKRDECLICKVPCRTILLSKHTDSDIRALFLGIDGLCRKYSMETSQVSEFQEKHRRRLLAFYGEKISSLEESLRKSALQLEQLQSSCCPGLRLRLSYGVSQAGSFLPRSLRLQMSLSVLGPPCAPCGLCLPPGRTCASACPEPHLLFLPHPSTAWCGFVTAQCGSVRHSPSLRAQCGTGFVPQEVWKQSEYPLGARHRPPPRLH
ncbi:probable E3 SUMO-protein ligase RNF212 isoform X3 [Camelus dromedarius]|uniref:probable E3 SUMO-protein ligase RNF212 isoform X3 n=1 Tax=Camelus dromedarius TaxID=9838 RepID=UPI00311A8B59